MHKKLVLILVIVLDLKVSNEFSATWMFPFIGDPILDCSGDSVDAVSFPLGPFVVDMLSNHPLAVCKVYKPHIYIFCKMAWEIITNLKCQPTLIWGEGV